jgi:hypothetical protein
MKISLNGVEIELVKCGHCGAEPTELDAAAALKKEETSGSICAICGKRNVLISGRLEHHFYGGKHEWMLEGQRDSMGHLYSYCGNGDQISGNFHLECMKKVAPGMQVNRTSA